LATTSGVTPDAFLGTLNFTEINEATTFLGNAAFNLIVN